jgi:hypothetical protein
MIPVVHIAVEACRRGILEGAIEPVVRLACPPNTVLCMIHGDSKGYGRNKALVSWPAPQR